jgi:hypothetical protein
MTRYDVKAAMQQLIATTGETLSTQRAAYVRYRDYEQLCADDAFAAQAAGDKRMADIHLASVASWRAMAERVMRDIDATERDLAECERMAGMREAA